MPKRPDPSLLKRIADGELAIHELAGVRLERVWGKNFEESCPLCDETMPHSQKTHDSLRPVRFIQLGRDQPSSKVREAELSYRRNRGGKLMRMEDILRYEMLEKEHPESSKTLCGVLGVSRMTVCRWCKRLGIPIRSYRDW